MKNLRKLLLFICFVLSFVLFACNEEFVGHNINVVCLSYQGSYTIEASEKQDKLYSGKVTVTATANSGYEFDHYLINGKEISTNPYVIDELLSNLDITIYFTKEGSDINNSNNGGNTNGGNTNGGNTNGGNTNGGNTNGENTNGGNTNGGNTNGENTNGGNTNGGNTTVIIEGNYEGDYYNSINFNSLSSDELFYALRELITETHTHKTTYEELKTKLQYTDASLEDEDKIMLFYAQTPFKNDWTGGKTWNREHVWPQSLGWFKTSGAGSDIHHIRPTDNLLNSTRGNDKYAEINGSTYLVTGSSTGKIQTQCKSSGDRFEPADEIKGDVARILMYLLVRYPESDKYTISIVCTSMDMLLRWNKLDPVSEFEARRNERSFEIQGNRNPFIDYPSLADKIWG